VIGADDADALKRNHIVISGPAPTGRREGPPMTGFEASPGDLDKRGRVVPPSSRWPGISPAMTNEDDDAIALSMCYVPYMTVDDIEKAIAKLAPDELSHLRAWFEEFEALRFDQKIGHVAKVDWLAEQVLADSCDTRRCQIC
jgi:hypothetical protein